MNGKRPPMSRNHFLNFGNLGGKNSLVRRNPNRSRAVRERLENTVRTKSVERVEVDKSIRRLIQY